ncbi:CCA tRNA nucleotidyltransferase [Candidatus Nitrosocosmicus agrestis]|jgi:tRNA nucleotidyltransferase (CCA-adding enzyme)|uniref:CCA tRNA nucleotidyltransferase n=1 Tax=Candidatus Nitrosocosmicus agrestis TaxID=2563600 RepID=UPI00122E0B21|nr:CCA tRNA nucleotidyltransferase [Candidatus Nitrosocosmicus sp. SS]KAA2283810.1 CCA tRNA nucleotidyltransferase [Candidatus Nitrosocosmicus sp. SS]KAF0870186.1 CCA tRNA nucleotidyltransferase [Candidatus Nitrosocosmicus sp. SS]
MNNLSVQSILEEISKRCIPTLSEVHEITECATKVKQMIESFVGEHKLKGMVKEIVYGGSFAKGTWLKNETDIDIFIKFYDSIDYDQFEKYGKQIGMLALQEFSPYLRYADHPYVEAIVEGIKVNVVPCYDVPFGEWKSAADRSPYHTNYIVNKLDPKQKNEVRILKKFMKSIKIYGAEISTEGFSGYVCEVLILKFGSFLSTIHFFSECSSEKIMIGIDESLTPTGEHFDRFDSFIVILDPIDTNRNLGSAISIRAASTLIQGSRKFLCNPSDIYFVSEIEHPIDPCFTDQLSSFILIIEFQYADRPSDVIWGQLKKLVKSIIKFSESCGFTILKSACSVVQEEKSCIIALLLESTVISPLFLKKGPEIFRGADLKKFLEVNNASLLKWLDNSSKTNCLLLRKHTNIQEYLRSVLNSNPGLIGIPKGIKSDFLKSYAIFTLSQIENFDTHIKNAVSELLYTDDRVF